MTSLSIHIVNEDLELKERMGVATLKDDGSLDIEGDDAFRSLLGYVSGLGRVDLDSLKGEAARALLYVQGNRNHGAFVVPMVSKDLNTEPEKAAFEALVEHAKSLSPESDKDPEKKVKKYNVPDRLVSDE